MIKAVMVNGKPYKQLYMAHVTTKDGKIVSHKEFLNTVVFVEAFFPNGLNDYSYLVRAIRINNSDLYFF